eukprot:4471641-Amphidinium_carterae.2
MQEIFKEVFCRLEGHLAMILTEGVGEGWLLDRAEVVENMLPGMRSVAVRPIQALLVMWTLCGAELSRAMGSIIEWPQAHVLVSTIAFLNAFWLLFAGGLFIRQ